MSVADLPALNASLNGVSALLIVTGLVMIKTEHKKAHAFCMASATAFGC